MPRSSKIDLDRLQTIASNFYLTVKAILFSPRVFFDQMLSSGEGDWLETFYFMAFCAAINALARSWMSYSVFRFIAGIHPTVLNLLESIDSPLLWFVIFLSFFLMLTFGAFIVSGATALFAKIFGGKGTYLETYKVIVCSSVVLLYSWIPYVGGLLSLYYFVLVGFGLSRAHELNGWKTAASLIGGSTTYVLTTVVAIFCVMLGTFAYLNIEFASLVKGISPDITERIFRGQTN